MTEDDAFRRYLEAGTTFTQVTHARSNELVQELIKTGELEYHKAQEWVGGLVTANRQRSGMIISTVRGEVRKQLQGLGLVKPGDLAPASPSKAAPSRKLAAGKTTPKRRGGVTVSPPGST